MKSKLSLACMLIVALLGGCASGPSFSTYSGSIPPLDSQKARFYFYRSTLLGGAIQPPALVPAQRSRGGSLRVRSATMTSQPRGNVIIDPEECKGCGLCVDSCPPECLVLAPELSKYRSEEHTSELQS